MNLTKIYKAIDEGLKSSLIDFGNNRIQKTDRVDSTKYYEDEQAKQELEKWLDIPMFIQGYSYNMPVSLYKKVAHCINIFYVEDEEQLNDIILRTISEDSINAFSDHVIDLNWINIDKLNKQEINISNISDEINNIGLQFGLNIEYWNTNIISNEMFSDISYLTNIILPHNINKIENLAFYCTNLESIKIPASVDEIGKEAFEECQNLTTVYMSQIKSIGGSAFTNCKNLNSVVFPNTLQYIGEYAFMDCTSLTSIVLPKNLKYICFSAFTDDYNLKDVKYNGTISQWKQISKDYNIFDGTLVETIQCIDGECQIYNN